MGESRSDTARRRNRRSLVIAVAVLAMLLPTAAFAQDDPDPRVGLAPGLFNAGEAISNLEKTNTWTKDQGTFWNPASPGSSSYWISDIAFQGDLIALGNFWGFQLFDNSNPEAPVLLTEVVCPGGQGDPTLYGNLLFRSVEGTNGRADCGTQGNSGDTAAATRFRGVQIFDISNLAMPVQVGGVQLCRGSHTHTLVRDPDDAANVYIYNGGTAGVSNSGTNTHCNSGGATTVRPSQWMTEVIRVPLANPAAAEVINEARLFTDPATGAVNGLGSVNHCHDLTSYPEIDLIAGACQGRGLLIDTSDVANPKRIDAVADSNFAYWHSATFSNDGTKVVFTDELGGGTGARCRVTDPLYLGANAIYDVVQTDDGPRLSFQSYYKMPAVQTSQENCVAHNGTLIPVPGRDIMSQAWYQGGVSLFDFTDSANPVEIAYFDRGPVGATLLTGGFWSVYWHNGRLYGSEIARGLDTFKLVESEHLSAAEIAAAEEITTGRTNAQDQVSYEWGPSLNVIGAYRDQLARIDGISAREVIRVDDFLDDAEAATTRQQLLAAAAYGYHLADRLDPATQGDLIDAVLLVADDLYAQARP